MYEKGKHHQTHISWATTDVKELYDLTTQMEDICIFLNFLDRTNCEFTLVLALLAPKDVTETRLGVGRVS